MFADEIYYAQVENPDTSPDFDSWTGVLAPTPNADGTVFSDGYVLPLFLRTLYDFMLTAAVFDPGFITNYKDVLEGFASRLQAVYKTSTDGIVTVRVPGADALGVNLNRAGGTLQYTAEPVAPGNPPPLGVSSGWGTNDSPGVPMSEYGVVHLYSGYANLSYYPSAPQEGISQPPVPDIQPNLFLLARIAVLKLAVRRNWKEAYAFLGFPAVWSALNMLNNLTGNVSLGPIDLNTVWTFREIEEIFSSSSAEAEAFFGDAFTDPGLPASTITKLALAALQAGPASKDVNLGPEQGLTSIEPAPTGGSPKRPLSFRNALSSALAAATNTLRVTPEKVGEVLSGKSI